LPFSDVGFHSDFIDKGNQVFHVWPYVIAGANGPVGSVIGTLGNLYHEIYQHSNDGKSWEDYALANAGMRVGYLTYGGKISPSQFGDTLRYMLGPLGPGSGGFVQKMKFTYPYPYSVP
jgi:hypothetical protein